MCRVRNATYGRIGAWGFGFSRSRDSYPDIDPTMAFVGAGGMGMRHDAEEIKIIGGFAEGKIFRPGGAVSWPFAGKRRNAKGAKPSISADYSRAFLTSSDAVQIRQ